MKKKIVPLILLVIVGVLTWAYIEKDHLENADTLTLYGNVDIRDVGLGFRVSGRLEIMNYEEGDTIKKGDVLAVLDKIPFQDELDANRAALKQVEVAYTNSEKLFERRAKLVTSGAITQEAYDDALAVRDEEKAHIETAKADVHLSETRLADTDLLAPNDGTILTRVREVGAIVAAGEIIYTMALHDPIWIRTYVDEPNLGHVFEGQKATVTTDSGGVYEGQVGFISPQAEFTPKNVETTQLRTDLVYRLRIIVSNADHGLRQGMPVTVTLHKGQPKDE